MVDWGAGSYERTAAELAPVAQAVVSRAAVRPGDDVLDLACGTGNAALLAAECGARVIGIDGSARLLEVARGRAQALGVEVDFREGDLLDLPADDDGADVVLSVFGLIYAQDPAQAMGEVARVTRPEGRAYVTAWVPAGPIDAMFTALGSILTRVSPAPAPVRFPWSDPTAVAAIAAGAGLSLVTTTPAELEIRDSSPEEDIAAGQAHPLSLAVQPVLADAGAAAEAQAAMTAVLREANEDPDGFLVHSTYVVHELRAG
jgi:SAM-dependent methyltransferase